MINIGSKQLKGISIGNRAVKEVYKGSQKIWSSASWKTIFTGSIDNTTKYSIPFKVGYQYRVTFSVYGTTTITSPLTFTHNGQQTLSYTATKSGRDNIGNRYSVEGKLIIHLFSYSNDGNIRCTRNSTYVYDENGNQYTVYGGFIVTKVEEFS
jgi:hypothetical protein